jgi:hypothetical protein
MICVFSVRVHCATNCLASCILDHERAARPDKPDLTHPKKTPDPDPIVRRVGRGLKIFT